MSRAPVVVARCRGIRTPDRPRVPSLNELSPRPRLRSPALVTATLLFAFAAAASPAHAADAVGGIARLQAPPSAVKPIKAVANLPVRATPVAPGQPVEDGALLVEMDLETLEKELAMRRQELASIQEDKRYRATNKEVRRGGGGSSNLAQGPDNSIEMELVQKEANATRDLLEVQTRISTASPHAPTDGYLVHLFYDVGAETKKRKPLLTFIAADETLVSVVVPPEAIAAFPPGSRVAIVSSTDPTRRFEGTVEKPAKGSDPGRLSVRPAGLPFLNLDQEAPVTVSPVR